jgi:hypothetical protein
LRYTAQTVAFATLLPAHEYSFDKNNVVSVRDNVSLENRLLSSVKADSERYSLLEHSGSPVIG